MAIATAEWIVYRYASLFQHGLPWQFLESAWAQLIDGRYGQLTIEGDTDRETWAGPVRRPIWRALYFVEFSIFEKEHDRIPELGAAHLIALAEYVMTDSGPFQQWCRRVLDRLQGMYPRGAEDHLGDVIPREALDPDGEFDPNDTEFLMNQFLSGLDYRANPFLSSPEKMHQLGFKGTPYVFRLVDDRRARAEW